MWILLFSVLLASLNVKPAIGALDLKTIMNFFGVGEPLLWRSIGPTHEKLNVTKAFDIMQSLGVRRLREWVWRCLVFNENGTGLDQTAVEELNKIVMEAKSRNITVMGMVQDFPSWMTGIEEGKKIQQSVPKRNLTEGSPYDNFLKNYTWSWQVLTEAFPNITMWEIGNEYNLNQFLHPENYPSKNFTLLEKVEIMIDLLYFGSKAIHDINPNATTVLGGLGGLDNLTGIHNFLNRLYEKIQNVTCHPYTNSTNPDDFFQVVSWHPYLNNTPPDQSWIDQNKQIHDVMVSHGDGDKPVVFSEFGYSDVCTGLNETQVAEYLNTTYIIAWENLRPWLETIYWFRLINPDPCYDVGLSPKAYGFGLVKRPAENYAWKPAAHAYKITVIIIEEIPVEILLIIAIVLTSLTPVLTKFLNCRKYQSIIEDKKGAYSK